MKPVWIFLGIMVVCILLCQGAWAIEVFNDPPCGEYDCSTFDGSWGHIALIFMTDAILAAVAALITLGVISEQRNEARLAAVRIQKEQSP